MADRDRWTDPRSTKSATADFGREAKPRDPSVSEDDEYAFAHIRSNPSLSAISISASNKISELALDLAN